jgi:hypothetical protein
MRYEVGYVILVQSGEYSDKSTHGVFRVKVAFEKDAMIDAFKLTKAGEDYFEHGEFVTWLDSQGVVEEIIYHVMHIGSYGDLA